MGDPMGFRPRFSPLIIFFLILVFMFVFLSIYEAYSVYITISTVEPLPLRSNIEYFFFKVRQAAARWAEVRGIQLVMSGSQVSLVDVTWYRRLNQDRYITISITLKDDLGQVISSGQYEDCYIGSGLLTSRINLSPIVDVDKVARVESSLSIGGRCLLLGAGSLEMGELAGEEL